MTKDRLNGDSPENLERVDWMTIEDWNMREKTVASRKFETFEELASAIDEHGPLELCKDTVNVTFIRTQGRYEKDIIALRQSGLNVRRILIKKSEFEQEYGNFQGCLDHMMGNNAVGADIEYAHIRDSQIQMDLDPQNIDKKRNYSRIEVDLIAVLQMLEIRDEYLKEEPDDTQFINFIFDIGFTAGRVFSAVQNIATLEPDARVGATARSQNIKRGKKSGSDIRKQKRLLEFMNAVETVFKENEHLHAHEEMLLKVAFDLVIPKGTYGHGRFEEYCTTLRSEEPFKARFNILFRKSLK